MRPFRRIGFPTVLCAILLAVRWAAAWTAPVPEGMAPRFVLSRMSKPPVLDGRIGADEWREATAVSGVGGCMNNVLIARPTTFFLGWDGTNLYMAVRTLIKPGYKPRNGGRQPGAATVFDDCTEFHFMPMGANVPHGTTPSSYKFIMNTLGYFGDFNRVSVGQQFKNWNPDFRSKTGMTPPGSAPMGGRWWEAEVVMPAASFELAGENRAGDAWRVMLGINHMYAGWTQARVSAGTSYFDPSGYPVATLAEKAPAVQMTMDELPGLMDGVASVRYRVHNPAAVPAAVEVGVEYRIYPANVKALADAAGTTEVLRESKVLPIAPGATAEFAVSKPLPETPAGRTLLARYTAKQNGREIFGTFHFFRVKEYPKAVFLPDPPSKQAFPLDGTFNPVAPNFLVSADSYYLDDPEQARSVRYAVTRDADGATVAAGDIQRPVTFFYRRLVPLPSLKPGGYTLAATMTLKNGSVLGPEKIAFRKLDEAKEFPEWWRTRLGGTERVLKPFRALGGSGATVAPWGRSYTLNALGLPEKVVSQGVSVMKGGARVVVTTGGKDVVVPLSGGPSFSERKEWRVRFSGTAAGGGLVFTAEGSVEQDGMVFVNLTYGPRKGTTAKVDGLRFEFPVDPAQAECFLCQGGGGNYASKTTMVLPQEKRGKLWTSLDTGINGSGMTVGSFYPALWIGNEKRGFLWYADSDRGWMPDDAHPAHELHREAGAFVIRNRIVPKPCTLTEERTIGFCYMASPFRPMAKNWRELTYSENGTFEGPNKEQRDPATKAKTVDGWNWLTPPSENPADWAAMWAGYKKIADARVEALAPTDPTLARNKYGSTVHTSLPLMGYGRKSPDKRVTDYFAHAWDDDVWDRSEQDYFLYIGDRAFREGGLRTIYWDIFFLKLCASLQTGLAYELPDGRIQPGYNGLNIRRFMMRMYAVMQDNGLVPNSQVSHATNCYCLPAMGWMDAVLDGEYHAITDSSGMDWVDGYPVDRMRAMSVSGQFGCQISWMSLMQIKDPAKSALAARGKREYVRLYDTWKDWGASVPPQALDWGLAEDATEYVPFWRNPFAKAENPDILVSLWRRKDRAVLVVFNYNRTKTLDAAVRVDLDALGLVPRRPWEEFVRVRDLDKPAEEPATKLDFHARTVTLPKLLPHTGRVIGLRLY